LSCDTLSLEPLRLILNFAVTNSGGPAVCEFTLTGMPAGRTASDSCRVVDVVSPPGWSHCANAGSVSWYASLDAGGGYLDSVAVGERLEPLAVVLDLATCCQASEFFDGMGMAIASGATCFPCEEAVPALIHTWGRLKAHYR
jgi:hypothetical protein